MNTHNDPRNTAKALEPLAARLTDGSLSPHELGRAGEDYACALLRTHGWRVLDRNWHSRYGELDIVGVDTDGCLVFVEVKTRRGVAHGTSKEAVTEHKRTALRHTSYQWLREHPMPALAMRHDVMAITVYLPRPGEPAALPQVEMVKGAF
ncbi:MAG: YraN family protein [Bifidobacteriaceae bacterium]|nr:YraN family protein [Bifidobacteriaceae bacterium]